MITSSRNYPLGGRITYLENQTFRCTISTAKEGLFKKQSTNFIDSTSGVNIHIGKILYNEHLCSSLRLELHDKAAIALDAMGNAECPLHKALAALFDRLQEEKMAICFLAEPD
jgi:hypothetical protein